MKRAVVGSREKTALTAPEKWRSSLGGFGAVLGAGLAPVLDSGGVKGAADDVITNPGEVLDPSTPNEHNGVLLQVVANAGDVGRHLKS